MPDGMETVNEPTILAIRFGAHVHTVFADVWLDIDDSP